MQMNACCLVRRCAKEATARTLRETTSVTAWADITTTQSRWSAEVRVTPSKKERLCLNVSDWLFFLVDIDECLDESQCEGGQCQNTDGSFICLCKHPMVLDPNSNQCVLVSDVAGKISPVENNHNFSIALVVPTQVLTFTGLPNDLKCKCFLSKLNQANKIRLMRALLLKHCKRGTLEWPLNSAWQDYWAPSC